MNFIKKNLMGIIVCLVIAVPSWLLGKQFPIIGGAVIAIIAGMVVVLFWNDKGNAESGIKFTRTLMIIPITLVLSFIRAKKAREEGTETNGFSFKRAFPMFILYFVLASIVTTVALQLGRNYSSKSYNATHNVKRYIQLF